MCIGFGSFPGTSLNSCFSSLYLRIRWTTSRAPDSDATNPTSIQNGGSAPCCTTSRWNRPRVDDRDTRAPRFCKAVRQLERSPPAAPGGWQVRGVHLEQLPQEVITCSQLARQLARERQRHRRELGEQLVESTALDDRDRRGAACLHEEGLHVAGEQRERAEAITRGHPRVELRLAFADLDLDLAAHDNHESRLIRAAVAPSRDQLDALEPAGDPCDLVRTQVLEDRERAQYRFEL